MNLSTTTGYVKLLLAWTISHICLASYGQITRPQIISNATPYTNFSWTANTCNLNPAWNGTFCGGRNVYSADVPWVNVGTNISMPYMWGGWSTISQHNAAMSNCKSAGDVCSTGGGGCSGNTSGLSQQCASGHDCSGLVSRAWALSNKQGTTTLPNFATSIAFSQLQQGDAVNKSGDHTRLISTYNVNGSATVIEASGTDWKTSFRTYSVINQTGYVALCYNNVQGGCGGGGVANDNCPGQQLFSNTTCVNTNGTVAGATESVGANQCTGCSCTSPDDYDVFYYFEAVQSTHTITLSNMASNFDGVIEIRDACGSGGNIQCYDPSGAPDPLSYTYNGFDPGETYYIRVYEYNNSGTPPSASTFSICVTHTGGDPDLVPLNQQLSDITVTQNQTITAYCASDNDGSGVADEHEIGVWISADDELGPDPDDFELGEIDVQVELQPNSQSTLLNTSVQIPANICAGIYWIFFWVDNEDQDVNESMENNNFASVQITVSGSIATPTTPTSNSPQCGNVTITRGTPPAGITWYWQGTSCGTSQGSQATTYSAGATGTYYLRARSEAGPGCWSSNCSSIPVVVNTAPFATISYNGSPYCSNGGSASITRMGTAGGTYSSTAGLSINSSSGLVNLGASTAGTYTVTYTIAAGGGCPQFQTTTSITITAQPSANISYPTTPFCSNEGVATVTQSGTGGGSYSSTAGLSLNSTTGAVDLDASNAGSYTVTYTIPASGGCAQYQTTGSIGIQTAPDAVIVYDGSPYCSSTGGSASVTRTGSPGGTYSAAPAGLMINTTSGLVNIATSTPGTYTVTYSIAASGACAQFQTTTTITISSSTTWYADTDNDGAGDPNSSLLACDQPVGYVADNTDFCPGDPLKTQPGQCGCGIQDLDDDGDGVANCIDPCDNTSDGQPCDDNNACTVNEVLVDCNCGGGLPVDPSDGDPCTLDSCDPLNGVSNVFQDADGDGTCDANELCPGSPEPGTPCDDQNACTTGEQIQSDCTCGSGVAVDPNDGDPCTLDSCDPVTGVSNVFQDTDGDGVCDANDPCPALADVEPGDACDDGDPCTANDEIDGTCSCTGTPTSDTDSDGLCDLIDPCPALANVEPGDTCDDGDPCTVNDQIDGSCSCAGTPTIDTDGDGLCDAIDPCPALANVEPGDVCDDQNACTTGEQIQSDCTCGGGIAVDPDDGDPCTLDSCDPVTGVSNVFQDTDSDGLCDAIDSCPVLPNVEPGDTCDDGDQCTTNDQVDVNCSCLGVPAADTDSDGLCDLIDPCPAQANVEPGDACDDGAPCTTDDQIDGSCSCVGVPQTPDTVSTVNGPSSIAIGTAYDFWIDEVLGVTSYDWSFNGSPWISSINDSISFTIQDLPTVVCVRTVNACGVSDSVCVTFDFGTSIGSVDGTTWFTIHPNPSTGTFFLTPARSLSSSIEVSVVDVLGQAVSHPMTLSAKAGVTIDLGGVAEGMYYLRASGAGSTQVIELMIQR